MNNSRIEAETEPILRKFLGSANWSVGSRYGRSIGTWVETPSKTRHTRLQHTYGDNGTRLIRLMNTCRRFGLSRAYHAWNMIARDVHKRTNEQTNGGRRKFCDYYTRLTFRGEERDFWNNIVGDNPSFPGIFSTATRNCLRLLCRDSRWMIDAKLFDDGINVSSRVIGG